MSDLHPLATRTLTWHRRTLTVAVYPLSDGPGRVAEVRDEGGPTVRVLGHVGVLGAIECVVDLDPRLVERVRGVMEDGR